MSVPYMIVWLINWLVITVSFFNTITMLWLGFTVLFNAERRSWGVWAAGTGLLLSGMFFAAHSATVGQLAVGASAELSIWWRLGWLPFVCAPYLWYVVSAWYSGALRRPHARLRLAGLTLLGLAILMLPLYADPLPPYDALLRDAPVQVRSVFGVPLVAIYPGYGAACIVLSLRRLLDTGQHGRFMGDLARRRARPWLLATSVLLLLICLSVAAVAWLLLNQLARGSSPLLSGRVFVLLLGFDLVISVVIAGVTFCVGQAIVAYEVFTGTTLPRSGLRRHWRRSIIFAAGYSAAIAAGLAFFASVDRIYALMLATVLMTLFLALVSWRAFADRERTITQLRPFVASQRRYDRLLHPDAPEQAAPEIHAPLAALCDDLLGARVVYLVALGRSAALVGALPAAVGETRAIDPAAMLLMPSMFPSPATICARVDPDLAGGALWAVPLWDDQGLVGALLLGPKREGGLYTQEDIEVARATGERLLDLCAGAELTSRVVLLQRRRMAESQLIDRRTRRVLHDDVLPQIHAALIALSAPQPQTAAIADALTDAHRRIADLLRDMPTASLPDIAEIGLPRALQRLVEGEMRGGFDTVRWHVTPAASSVRLEPATAEVAFYAAREVIRNSARHARGTDAHRSLTLDVAIELTAAVDALQLRIADDGVGIGYQSSAVAGSGRGLAMHHTLLTIVGGTLLTAETPGGGLAITLVLPLST